MSIIKSKKPFLKAMVKPTAALKTLLLAATVTVGALAQTDTARIPFLVNADANANANAGIGVTVIAQLAGGPAFHRESRLNVAMGTEGILIVPLTGITSTGVAPNRVQRHISAPAVISKSHGNIILTLSASSYGNAEIAIYSVNGRQILRDNVTASETARNISRPNLVGGVYLLSVKDENGSKFSSRLTHNGGRLNMSVMFGGIDNITSASPVTFSHMAANEAEYWRITVMAGSGYSDTTYMLSLTPGLYDSQQNITLRSIESRDFKESLSTAVELDMVFVEGGKYIRGCPEGFTDCVVDETPPHNVTLSSFYTSATDITRAQWHAVMGGAAPNANQANQPAPGVTWYAAVDFVCKLSTLTGKPFRLLTDAEWEFAARGGNKSLGFLYPGSNIGSVVAQPGSGNVAQRAPNELGIYDMMAGGEEWVWDNWKNGGYGNVDNLVDPAPRHVHTQKVRRGGEASDGRVSMRKIRSIEGSGPRVRVALSVEGQPTHPYPGEMVGHCEIQRPVPTPPQRGYRDRRLITAEDEAWIPVNDDGSPRTGFGMNIVVVRENMALVASQGWGGLGGSAVNRRAEGEWYTIQSFSLNIVSLSGESVKYMYYLIDDFNMTMMGYRGTMLEGMPMRYQRLPLGEVPWAAGLTVAAAPNPLTNPDTLARRHSPSSYGINMANPPTTVQDSRLMEGPGNAWFQNNEAAGGTHHYRHDFDSPTSARFAVFSRGGSPMWLAVGTWFTVDNSFLRITGANGDTRDYLYNVTANDSIFYHISFMDYEPGDFRMFRKVRDADVTGWTEPSGGTPANGGYGASLFRVPE